MTAAVLVLHQQEAITCADWFAFTGSIDGLLAHCSSLCISAVLAARAVSVTVKKSINPTFDSIVVIVFSKKFFIDTSLGFHTCTLHDFWTCNWRCSRGHRWGGEAQGRNLPHSPLWSFHRLCCSSLWSTAVPCDLMSSLQKPCCSWRNAWGKTRR